MIVVLVGWLKLGFLFAVLVEVGIRIGGGAGGLLRLSRLPALTRDGSRLLIGWGVLGVLLFGFACVGLFFPSIVLGATVSAALGWRNAAMRKSYLVDTILTWARLVGTPGVLGLLLVAPALYPGLIPAFGHDSYLYHLGAPWEFLQSHRVVLSDVSWTFCYPLPVEMTLALSLLLGDDRLSRLMGVGAFAAACSVFADRCRLDGNARCAWIGPLLALSSWNGVYVLTEGKSDMMASSLFVAGGILFSSGPRFLGSVLLGLCMPAKMTCIPLVLAWVVVHPPPWRSLVWACLGLGLPILPWLVKNYLAVANPLFPFLSSLFVSLNWGEANDAVLRDFVGRADEGGAALLDIPAAWLGLMRSEYLPILLALPALAIWRASRHALVGCLLGQFFMLLGSASSRYLFPSMWYLSLLAAGAACRVPGGVGRIAVGMLVTLSLARFGLVLREQPNSWQEILLTRDEILSKKLTVYEEAVKELARVDGRRVLAIGERMAYRLPGRTLFDAQIGETPVVWKMVRESRDVDRLRIRFRQRGVDVILYNFVSAEWLGIRYGPFVWDSRMLRLYAEFAKRYHEIVWRSRTNDHQNGGYYIYRLLKQARFPPADAVWFLPGTEQVYQAVVSSREKVAASELLVLRLRVLKILPDVGQAWNKVGQAYSMDNDAGRAYEHLGRFVDQGMVDGSNVPLFAGAALNVGKLEEAYRIMRAHVSEYTSMQAALLVGMADVCYRKAEDLAARKNDGMGALRLLDEASEWLNRVQGNQADEYVDHHAKTSALVAGLRGDIEFAMGHRADALRLYREAVDAAPESVETNAWVRQIGIIEESQKRSATERKSGGSVWR